MTLVGAVVTSRHRDSASRHWYVHHYDAGRDCYRLDPRGEPLPGQRGGVRPKWVTWAVLHDPARWDVIQLSPFTELVVIE